MNTKKILFIAFLGAFLLTGCNEQIPGDNSVEDCEIIEFQESKSMSPLLKKLACVQVIPLKNEDQIVLSSNLSLYLMDNCYIIADRQQSAIYRFSKEGDFTNNIGHLGKGPGEFLNISDVQIIDNNIHVYSSPGRELIYSPDGTFISENSIPAGFHSYRTDSGLVTYHGYSGLQPYRVIYTETSSGKETGFLSTDAKLLALDIGNNIFCPVSDGQLCFIDSYSPTVYCLSEGSVKPYLSFDFGKYTIKESFYSSKDPFSAAEMLMSSDYSIINSYCESGDYRLVQAMLKKKSDQIGTCNYGLCHKGVWSWFSLQGVEEEPYPGPLKTIKDNALFGIFTKHELTSFVDQMDNTQKKTILCNETSENNIVILKLK